MVTNNLKGSSFYRLFCNELKDVLSAEKQIIKCFPTLIQAATFPELKEALQLHFNETKNQVTRLEQIFSILGEKPLEETCEGMEGLIKELKKTISEFQEPAVRDAALICQAQRVEHYEIAAYGTLRTFANQLELNEIEDLLQESLDEEGSANKKLTSIAEGGFFTTGINQRASQFG